MPQIIKGGKYIFGWSIVSGEGIVLIPEEARLEYGFSPGERVIFVPGSKTSGGFSICKKSAIEKSRLSDFLLRNPNLADFRIAEGEIINIAGRRMCWAAITEDNRLRLTPHMLEAYGVNPQSRLLAGRGSNIGLAMMVKGPIVAEAENHPEIPLFITEAA